MLRELETTELTIGMYVCDLDRPWLGTPFPVQGFYVGSQQDIDRLAQFCRTVFVDPRRFDSLMARDVPGSTLSVAIADEDPGLPPRVATYDDHQPVEDELPAAREALLTSSTGLEAFWNQLSTKRQVRIEDVKAAVDPLVESILRNKDALVALMRVQRADRHTHEHCMAMAVWASLMGRQLGLAPDAVKSLALGCSLVDVGMVRLPQSLLSKPNRSGSDEAIYRSHVDFSLEILERMGTADDELSRIIRWHHERMDGSGYPDGLVGSSIPMMARIAGVVDAYDTLISPRDQTLKRSSFEALMELQDACPKLYQAELMEQFARAVGIFPSGALVELNTGEVAVVFGQNTGRRLRPKVILILDADHQRRSSFPVVDLSCANEQHLRISRELAQNEYGIDAREYFI